MVVLLKAHIVEDYGRGYSQRGFILFPLEIKFPTLIAERSWFEGDLRVRLPLKDRGKVLWLTSRSTMRVDFIVTFSPPRSVKGPIEELRFEGVRLESYDMVYNDTLLDDKIDEPLSFWGTFRYDSFVDSGFFNEKKLVNAYLDED